ncbi:hypothetical protein [Mesorhizobium sp. 1M-11]|uniref:hypothetical protein n=1 Tax=Mesorhizobium sp. 1M-11 TaxID=1529006 RepID=UPI0006C76BB7|nr:hypothetical protein [Mesorhizobium sp. 1M-11]
MYKFVFILTAFIALSASKTTEQQNAEARQKCRSPGFADGSLAGCMNTAAAARAADRDRQEAQSEARQAFDNTSMSHGRFSLSQHNGGTVASVPPVTR